MGGAIIPPLTGQVADISTLRMALIAPAICYAGIAAQAGFRRRQEIVSTGAARA